MAKLKAGKPAPEFEALDEQGKTVRLQDFAGKKLVLFFYPKDNTPTCTVEACNLRDNYKALKKQGYEVVGVSINSAKSHQNFINKFKLPYKLIADIDQKLTQQYGLWAEKTTFGRTYMGTLRTTVLIDEKGIIERIITDVESKRHAEQILQEQ